MSQDEANRIIEEFLKDIAPHQMFDLAHMNLRPGEYPEGYVGVKEAAVLVGKSTDSIRRAIRSGKVKASQGHGRGQYFIDEADLLKVFPRQPEPPNK